ncbi:hypothetical protein IEQ34_022263 [Dendrobium chrysotoxum]|uniref:Uncharacterized protein n=1 Tax=Dendrobium chrysotoxum TaxID=161865 RepID=A0AAV7FYJ8_DENCH|nr:hypothetical protein IEQ34_022263 [Dendrobium chrysotoxum]
MFLTDYHFLPLDLFLLSSLCFAAWNSSSEGSGSPAGSCFAIMDERTELNCSFRLLCRWEMSATRSVSAFIFDLKKQDKQVKVLIAESRIEGAPTSFSWLEDLLVVIIHPMIIFKVVEKDLYMFIIHTPTQLILHVRLFNFAPPPFILFTLVFDFTSIVARDVLQLFFDCSLLFNFQELNNFFASFNDDIPSYCIRSHPSLPFFYRIGRNKDDDSLVVMKENNEIPAKFLAEIFTPESTTKFLANCPAGNITAYFPAERPSVLFRRRNRQNFAGVFNIPPVISGGYSGGFTAG